MKRNFFKNSLAAFAFSLAIVASFAFSNAQNDDVTEFVNGYVQTFGPKSCDLSTTPCNEIGMITCTVGHINGNPELYSSIGDGVTCNTPLLTDDRQEDPQ